MWVRQFWPRMMMSKLTIFTPFVLKNKKLRLFIWKSQDGSTCRFLLVFSKFEQNKTKKSWSVLNIYIKCMLKGFMYMGQNHFIYLKKNLFSFFQSFLQLMVLNDGTSSFFLYSIIYCLWNEERLFCIMFWYWCEHLLVCLLACIAGQVQSYL